MSMTAYLLAIGILGACLAAYTLSQMAFAMCGFLICVLKREKCDTMPSSIGLADSEFTNATMTCDLQFFRNTNMVDTDNLLENTHRWLLLH